MRERNEKKVKSPENKPANPKRVGHIAHDVRAKLIIHSAAGCKDLRSLFLSLLVVSSSPLIHCLSYKFF